MKTPILLTYLLLHCLFVGSKGERLEPCFGNNPMPKAEFEKALQAVCGVGAQQSPDTLLLICPFFHDFFQCDHTSFIQKVKDFISTEATLEIDLRAYKAASDDEMEEKRRMVFPPTDTITISTDDDIFVNEPQGSNMFEVRIEYYF